MLLSSKTSYWKVNNHVARDELVDIVYTWIFKKPENGGPVSDKAQAWDELVFST